MTAAAAARSSNDGPDLFVLGPTAARGGASSDLLARSPRARSLLALLVLRRPEPVPAELATSVVWAHLDHAGARRELQRTATKLRTALAGCATRVHEHDLLRLEASPGVVDVEHFEQQLDLALERTASDPLEALVHARVAADSWRDDRAYASLEGWPEAVAEAERLAARRCVAFGLRDGLRVLHAPDVLLVPDLELRVRQEDGDLAVRQLAAALAGAGRTAEALARLSEHRRGARASGAVVGFQLDALEQALLRAHDVDPTWILPAVVVDRPSAGDVTAESPPRHRRAPGR